MAPEIYTPRDQRSEKYSFAEYLDGLRQFKDNDPASVFIVAVNASREGGNTERALQIMLKRIESYDCRTALIQLINSKMSDDTDSYSNDPKSPKLKHPVPFDDDLPDMHNLLILADGIILGTSTRWAAAVHRMHKFKEHLTALEHSGWLLEGKVCFIVATAEDSGPTEAIKDLWWSTNEQGMSTIPYSSVYILTGKPKEDKLVASRMRPPEARLGLELGADNMVKRILIDRFFNVDWGKRANTQSISRLQQIVRKVELEGKYLSERIID